ncbi:MAG: C1 family peptidase [bacterium]|nr:C1 family peptidase [bacterium]
MPRLLSLVVVLILALTFCAHNAAAQTGGLTSAQARRLVDGVVLDAPTRAAMNAVSGADPRDLALNRQILMQSDDLFPFQLPDKGITDQEKTGRCWLFAGLNILRHDVIKKLTLDDFELSQSYLAFWDRLEKANVFLEFMIEMRERDLLDRELDHLLDDPISDGGYWEYVVNLVEKYGVVPKSFMGETYGSANTGRMDYLLDALLRRDAARLRTLSAAGKSEADLREEKLLMLKDVARILVIHYGMPPAEFAWRAQDDSGHVSAPVVYTPQNFYREVVGVDLSDYVSLASYPIHPFGTHYEITLTRSMADKPNVDFVNIPEDDLQDIALRALLDSNRVWFGCDMSHDVYSKRGLMITGLYDYDELLGVSLGMDKEQRLDYRHSASNHAMVLTGVDLTDGKPRRWRVENSWGKEPGDDGFFTMSSEWFHDYVLNVIVPKKYLSREMRSAFDETPVTLPVWDPVWRSLPW